MAVASARQAIVALRATEASARQALVRLSTPASARQGLVQLAAEARSSRQAVCRIFGSDFHAYTVAVKAETWRSEGRQRVPLPILDLSYAGHDMTGFLGDCQITRPLNGKTTLQFELRTPGGVPSDLAPPGFGAYAGIIRQHNGTSAREFALKVSLAGETWQCTPILPQPTKFNGYRLAWGGEDRTALLEQDRDPDDETVPFQDIIRAAGDSVMAHDAVKQASDFFGIPIICRYPNYLIGQCRRGQGSALAWLDSLAKPMQAARRWVGNTLVYEQVNPNAPVSWRFIDRLNIAQLGDIEELPRPKNKFILARFDPVGGPIGEDAGQQGNAVGRKSISFAASRFVVIDQLQALNVTLKDWVFKAADGRFLAGQGGGGAPYYQGSLEAVLAEFTSEPRFSRAEAINTAYQVVARGDQLPRSGSYRVTAQDTALQAIFGVFPEGKAIEEPTLGDQAGAELSVSAYQRESSRKLYKATFETPYLNPFVEPGQVIEIADYLTRQNLTKWVIETLYLIWRGRSWSMRIECYRGEQ